MAFVELLSDRLCPAGYTTRDMKINLEVASSLLSHIFHESFQHEISLLVVDTMVLLHGGFPATIFEDRETLCTLLETATRVHPCYWLDHLSEKYGLKNKMCEVAAAERGSGGEEERRQSRSRSNRKELVRTIFAWIPRCTVADAEQVCSVLVGIHRMLFYTPSVRSMVDSVRDGGDGGDGGGSGGGGGGGEGRTTTTTAGGGEKAGGPARLESALSLLEDRCQHEVVAEKRREYYNGVWYLLTIKKMLDDVQGWRKVMKGWCGHDSMIDRHVECCLLGRSIAAACSIVLPSQSPTSGGHVLTALEVMVLVEEALPRLISCVGRLVRQEKIEKGAVVEEVVEEEDTMCWMTSTLMESVVHVLSLLPALQQALASDLSGMLRTLVEMIDVLLLSTEKTSNDRSQTLRGIMSKWRCGSKRNVVLSLVCVCVCVHDKYIFMILVTGTLTHYFTVLLIFVFFVLV